MRNWLLIGFLLVPMALRADEPQEPDEAPPPRYNSDGLEIPYIQETNPALKPILKKTKNSKGEARQQVIMPPPPEYLDIHSIRQQITRCWKPPLLLKSYHESTEFLMHLVLDPDGFPLEMYLSEEKEIVLYAKENYYHALVDSAMQAIRDCAPVTGLPADRYDAWKSLDIHFDSHCMQDGTGDCLQYF